MTNTTLSTTARIDVDDDEPVIRHHPMLTYCRSGAYCHCSCGWSSVAYTTVTGAHCAFGAHLVSVTQGV